jgi:hypothetical protein
MTKIESLFEQIKSESESIGLTELLVQLLQEAPDGLTRDDLMQWFDEIHPESTTHQRPDLLRFAVVQGADQGLITFSHERFFYNNEVR